MPESQCTLDIDHKTRGYPREEERESVNITKLEGKHFKVQGSDDALLMTLHSDKYCRISPFISSESI